MLIVKKDENRPYDIGQYMVELVNFRDNYHVNNDDMDRFGYWCDKAHLGHLFSEFFKFFSKEEIEQIMKDGYWKS